MIKKNCLQCRKEFFIQFYRKKTAKFCSNKCHSNYLIGKKSKKKGKKYPHLAREGNSNWRGGKRIERGWLYIFKPEHPHCRQTGYIKNCRLVVESIIKRYLSKQDIVHHIDENKLNDNPKNLYLTTKSEHCRIHHSRFLNKSNLTSNLFKFKPFK